jgi:hypothetical protein
VKNGEDRSLSDLSDLLALTESEYEAVGRIAVRSAQLEQYVGSLIRRMCNLDAKKLGILMGRGREIGHKLDALDHLGALRLSRRPTALKEWKKLMEKLKGYNTTRSIAIHGLWSYLDADEFMEMLTGAMKIHR